MKKLITALLCLQFAVPPSAYGNPFMENAKSTVEEQNRAADHFLDAQISMDVNSSIVRSMLHLSKLKDADGRLAHFQQAMNNLEVKFSKFLENPEENIELSKEDVKKVIDAYSLLYSEAIGHSWTPMSIDQQFASVPGLIEQALTHLQETCNNGDWSENFDLAIKMGDKLPKFEYDYSIYIGNDQIPSVKFAPHNYVEDNKTQKFLLEASTVAFSATGMFAAGAATNYLAGTAVVGGIGGSASAAMVAAFPYAAVAVVVMIAITSISAARKREKMARQRLEADFFKFTNTRRSIWLKEEYKQRCQDVVDITKPFLKDVVYVQSVKSDPVLVEKYYSKVLPQLEKASNTFNEYQSAKCQVELAASLAANKCVSGEEYAKIDADEYKKKNMEIPNCFVEKDQAVSARQCVVPLKGGKVDLDVAPLEKTIAKFKKENSDQNSEMDFAVQNIRMIGYNMFVKNQSKFHSDVRSYVGNGLYKNRQMAFARLQKLIGIYRKAKFGMHDELIEKDLALFQKYSQMKARYIGLVAESIGVIFGTGDSSELRLSIKDFRIEMQTFYENYLHVKDVSDLMSGLQQLEKSMGLSSQPL